MPRKKDDKEFRFYWEETEPEKKTLFTGGVWKQRFESLTIPVLFNEMEDSLVVEANLPGFTKRDINVSIKNGILEIAAEKRTDNIEENRRFFKRETSRKSIRRSVSLPTNLAPEKFHFDINNGILKIVIPKK